MDVPRRGFWAAAALNSLVLHDSNSRIEAKLHGVPPNEPQLVLADRICSCLDEAGPVPEALDGEAALKSLGGSNDLYMEEPNNLATYSFEKVKVLHSDLHPRPLAEVLPSHTRALLERSDTFVVKSRQAISEQCPCHIQPYWDPVLRHSKSELVRLMVRLANQGLVSFRTHIRERVGIFCVKKKTPEWVRLIVDARRVNYMNNPPPTTRPATPRSYLDLQIPMGDDSDLGWGIEADVCDCFYNFVNPRTASMFGIDHPMSVAQWVQSGWRKIPIFDDDTGCNFTPSDETLVYPVFQGLCMGWSWALLFAQQAVSFIAAGRIERPINEVRDRMPMPDIQQQPCVGVYVDNIAIVGLQQDDVQQAADRVETYFREANIPLAWTSNKPLQVFETVGMVIDFKRRIIRNKPSRLWRAFLSGREILKRGSISVKLLERWLGHMTAAFMLAPYGLSCFFHIYKFIADNRDKRVYIWDSVRTEMRLALGVMWLARSSIQFDPIRQVDVGDSSASAFALLTTFATHNEIRDAVRWREVWRFCAMPDKLKEAVRRGDRQEIINLLEDLHEPPSDEQGVVRPGIPWGAGLMTQYAQWLTETIDDSSWLRTSAIRSQFRAKVRRRIQVDVPALVPPISDELCRKSRFTLLWRKRWRNSNTHINVKEARVAVSSLKRTARVKQLHNKLKLTLTDNMAGLCALERGRSSSFQLNLVCRAAAAYQFGSGIRWRLRHIETLRNPADEDSRFDKPDKKSKTSKPLVKRLSVGDAVSDEEVHLTQNSSGPCLGMMTSPTPSSSSGTSNRQRNYNSKNHRKGVFLEIFSGTARLTAAVREAGFACAPAIDILYGSHHDLRRRATQLALLSWIKAGWISVVHLGTPCTVFSRARHCIRDTERAREKERVGLEFAWFTAEVIETCRQHNIKWSLENPRFSRLFEVPVLATSLRDSFVVDLDFCRYGEPYRKATRIHTNNPDLLTLKKGCNHKKHDIVLRGSERIIENGKKISVPKTKNAGAYPYELVKVWAQILGPDLCLPHRDAQTNIAQCFQDLFAATTKGKYLSQSLQTASEIDPHFDFIKSGISTPQSGVVFGQDSNKEAARKRKWWECKKGQINWSRYQRQFNSRVTA